MGDTKIAPPLKKIDHEPTVALALSATMATRHAARSGAPAVPRTFTSGSSS
jgi:hypothetical protein